MGFLRKLLLAFSPYSFCTKLYHRCLTMLWMRHWFRKASLLSETVNFLISRGFVWESSPEGQVWWSISLIRNHDFKFEYKFKIEFQVLFEFELKGKSEFETEFEIKFEIEFEIEPKFEFELKFESEFEFEYWIWHWNWIWVWLQNCSWKLCFNCLKSIRY